MIVRFVFAVLLGAILRSGFGLCEVLLWLGVVAAACVVADAVTAKKRRADYLTHRAAHVFPPDTL